MEDGDSESREQGPPDECSPLSAESFREEGFPRTTLSTVVATCLFMLKLIKIKHHRDLRSSVAPASSRVPRGDVWLAATLLGSVIALQKLPALAVHWGSSLAGGRGGRAEGTIALCAGEAATPVLGVCPPGEAVPGSVVPSLPGSQAEAQQKPGCLGGVGGCPSGMEGAPAVVVSCEGSLGTCAARLLSACSPAPCPFSPQALAGLKGETEARGG